MAYTWSWKEGDNQIKSTKQNETRPWVPQRKNLQPYALSPLDNLVVRIFFFCNNYTFSFLIDSFFNLYVIDRKDMKIFCVCLSVFFDNLIFNFLMLHTSMLNKTHYIFSYLVQLFKYREKNDVQLQIGTNDINLYACRFH